MNKFAMCIVLMVALVVSGLFLDRDSTVTAAARPVRVLVNSEVVVFPDQQPVIVSGRTLVPVRFVSEALGNDVEWVAATSTVVIKGKGRTIALHIGRSNVEVDGVARTIDVPALLIGGRTMVPLRFISEMFGAIVAWDDSTYTVIVTTPPSQAKVPVTGVSLNRITLSLSPTRTSLLIATVFSANATNTGVHWSSSSPSVASVNPNGLVTAHAVGTAIITVTTLDGGKQAKCSVTVATAAPAISTGHRHTAALEPDGTVWAWGSNASGQLGDGTRTNRHAPIWVNGLNGVAAVVTGPSHTVALKSDGTVYAWGFDYGVRPIRIGGLNAVTAISAGWAHYVAIRADGTAWTWGSNASGQLGDGTTTSHHIPVRVSGLTGVKAISAGRKHTIALTSDGTVWAWGSNLDGRLGDGTSTHRLAPVQVSGLTGVTAISAGAEHTVALKSDGTVWAWGSNASGQLGDGTRTARYSPVQINGLTKDANAISAGHAHTVALMADGTVSAWGGNWDGRLGDGSTTYSLTPVQVRGLTGVTAISAGAEHTVALKSDGTVWTWGRNDVGQLGDDTSTNRHTPAKIVKPILSSAINPITPATPRPNIIINGQGFFFAFDIAPAELDFDGRTGIIRGGRTLVNLGYVSQRLGYQLKLYDRDFRVFTFVSSDGESPVQNVWVPIRFAGEALGAQATWNEANRTIEYRKGERTVTIPIAP